MTEKTSTEPAQKQDRKKRLERIGEELRLRREALGLDQGDVARQIHLPGMVVNDIETGQVDKLSSLYRRGYIRNYARLLGLDPDELLADDGESDLPQLRQVLPVSSGGWRLERYLKIATYAIVTVAIVPPLVYFFVAGGTSMLEREPAGAETAAELRSALNDRSAGSSPASASRPDTDDAPAARHVSASALPLNPIRPGKKALAETALPAAGQPETGAEAALPDAGPQLSALQLELLEDSWIEIHDAEGARLEYDLLRGGQTLSYEGRAPFRLLVGRSSAVELKVNGQPVTWEGHDSGDVAEIAVAADGQVKR
ncbi:MAG TPA: RodZ domain-containing protein [Wenzhouxiangella sp.]|nr:RodZ domain-containing protein [Wenzhouxiangella sp.]